VWAVRSCHEDTQHAESGHDFRPQPAERITHARQAALTNGVTRDEIREVFLQVAIYAGVPAAVDSFRIASEAFAELEQSPNKD